MHFFIVICHPHLFVAVTARPIVCNKQVRGFGQQNVLGTPVQNIELVSIFVSKNVYQYELQQEACSVLGCFDHGRKFKVNKSAFSGSLPSTIPFGMFSVYQRLICCFITRTYTPAEWCTIRIAF